MKAVLRYPGSKWNVTPKIIRLMPKHHSYLEPFFGSGAVLFNKKPSNIETINDLDLDVVNLFRCRSRTIVSSDSSYTVQSERIR